MFEMPFKKRLKQFLCKHNYFAVAVTDHYQEPTSSLHERVSIHKCDYCEHTVIIKKRK